MTDLNCGVQTWYLKPSFILKVLLGIFASVTLINLFVIDSRLYQHVWRKPIKNGNIAGTLTFFFIITVIITILIHFRFIMEKIPIIGNNIHHQVIIAGCISALTLIFALVFGCINVRSQQFNKLCDEKTGTFWLYWQAHSEDKKFVEWLQKYNNESKRDKYFKERTFLPGFDVLGLFITMTILDAILLYYFYQDRKIKGFQPVNDQTDEYLNPSFENKNIL